jgi:hypothetical protein
MYAYIHTYIHTYICGDFRNSRPSAADPINNFLVHHAIYIPGVENTKLLAIQPWYLERLQECSLQLDAHIDISDRMSIRNINMSFLLAL